MTIIIISGANRNVASATLPSVAGLSALLPCRGTALRAPRWPAPLHPPQSRRPGPGHRRVLRALPGHRVRLRGALGPLADRRRLRAIAHRHCKPWRLVGLSIKTRGIEQPTLEAFTDDRLVGFSDAEVLEL